MLQDKVILICEDETLIGLDLALSVEAVGGRVVGPVASVTEAMLLLEERVIDGAILDVNLKDGEVTPVALRLLGRDVPVVFQSGVGLPDSLKNEPLPLFLKPVQPSVLIENLADQLHS